MGTWLIRKLILKVCIHEDLIRNISDHVSFKEIKSASGESLNVTGPMWSMISKGRYVPKKRSYSPRIGEDKIKVIKDFWNSDEISRVSPCDTHTIKRGNKKSGRISEYVPVRHRQYSIKRTFEIFNQNNPGLCGRTTFFNHQPDWVKKPSSKQDFCEICKQAEIWLPRLEKKPVLTSEEIMAQESFEFHQELKSQRYRQFNSCRNNLVEGEALITIDFKANISLGKGPIENSTVFFKAPARTVFGAVGWFMKDKKPFKVVWTLISPALNHDSRVVKLILDQITSHGVFNQFQVKKINFWMDDAPNHFRTFETCATMYHIKEKKALDDLSFNYFAPYHQE